MSKSEIFAKIISLVEKETEVSRDRILSGDKDMEAVDARHMLVVLLFESGIYPSAIAAMVHKTHRCVNGMLSGFKERLKGGKMMRIQMDNLRKATGIN